MVDQNPLPRICHASRYRCVAIRNMSLKRWLMIICAAWLLALIVGTHHAPSAHAQDIAENHCLKGCPKGAHVSNRLISRSIYALSNNSRTKLADWVAYRVRMVNVDCKGSRSRVWKTDPDLKNETLEPKDYKHSNVTLHVDRGHQAPLSSFKCNADWQITNYLSNITPQFSKLNQGPWKELEAAVRKLARSGVESWVMTGPLFEWPMAKLPATKKMHQVPSSYWKIVAVENKEGILAAAFYFYQDTPKRANFCDHMRTINFIEDKANLDFFSDYDDQEVLERSRATLTTKLGCR